MRNRTRKLMYLVAAGAVAAMVGAPTALAQERQGCAHEGPIGTDIVCQSPGNVQINDSLPVLNGGMGFAGGFYPGPYAVPFAEGGI